ncbi:hypothetical protein [Butyrivibrio sp. YAB3001]|uniref:hypothetical protein n=1 Tax=Butyrivibrio sp. YAB3001 TaxID=1520812 RepID=UPI0008F62FDC|nr:hypothetical protein [Butyrivibrio sp. YAB3001]SFC18080.1 hypothetical protein SAMN02910398_01664 [Butyrivibrio sp. YAB3001]
MLDEEKVILMTKMAAFIDREGKKNDAINTYFRSDYVGYNIIKSVISATIVYAIFLGIYALCKFEEVLSNLYNTENLLSVGRRCLFYYLLLVGVYSLITYVVYSYRYSKMRKSMKAYYGDLKKLARLYKKKD